MTSRRSGISLGFSLFCLTLCDPASISAQLRAGWMKIPEIVVIGSAIDPRQVLVDEAISFWNQTLTELGSSFRLGSIRREEGSVAAEELVGMSNLVLESVGRGTPRWTLPESIRNIPGDLFVILSDADFVSFAGPFAANHQRMVAIKGLTFRPMNQPNVARNVIAHELGHAIGLGHNTDDTSLMCGRPSSCRPDLFRSSAPKDFPLTEQERKSLRALYPPTWTPSR